MAVGGLRPVVGRKHDGESVASDVDPSGVDVDSVVGGDGRRRNLEFEVVDGAVAHGDLQRIRGSRHRGEVEPPHAHVVGEVFLVDLGEVPVRGRPREVSCVLHVQSIAKLVVQINGDGAPHAGGYGSFASAQDEVRRHTGQDGHVHNHLRSACRVSHGHGVASRSERQEGAARHAAVAGGVREGLTGDRVAVLINH